MGLFGRAKRAFAMYEYGTFRNGQRARRNKITGEVQFVLWKAGEQGYTSDYWHASDASWWETFVPAGGDE